MSALLLVLISVCVPYALADYQLIQGYSTTTCSGAPIFNFDLTPGGACYLCGGSYGPGPNDFRYCTYSCINNTFGVAKVYSTSDCSGTPSSTSQQSGFSCQAGGSLGGGGRFPIPGLSVSSLCFPGQFVKPNTGMGVDLIPSFGEAPQSCDVAPVGVFAYATDVCMPDPATLQGVKATCGPGYAEIQHYSDQSCGGAAYFIDTFPLGCSLARDNSTLISCVPSPAAAAAPSALSAQLIYGGCGGAALLALLLVWWQRRGCCKQQQQPQQNEYTRLRAL